MHLGLYRRRSSWACERALFANFALWRPTPRRGNVRPRRRSSRRRRQRRRQRLRPSVVARPSSPRCQTRKPDRSLATGLSIRSATGTVRGRRDLGGCKFRAALRPRSWMALRGEAACEATEHFALSRAMQAGTRPAIYTGTLKGGSGSGSYHVEGTTCAGAFSASRSRWRSKLKAWLAGNRPPELGWARKNDPTRQNPEDSPLLGWDSKS
jgi:hypothetical protein